MYTIKGVNATPGGPVTVLFHDHGYLATPDRRRGSLTETLFGEGAGCLTLVVLLASVGLFSLLRKTGAPEAAVTACLWAGIVALCYGVLIVAAQWAGGVLVDLLVLLLAVATFPALLIPGYRRALRRRRGGGRPETDPGWVPATALAGVWHQHDPRGGAVVTVQRTDGTVTAYVPAPERARDLYERFDALLRSTRPPRGRRPPTSPGRDTRPTSAADPAGTARGYRAAISAGSSRMSWKTVVPGPSRCRAGVSPPA
ncbi:hypothetical protein WDV06_16910 [Streptomyces racemochromogenes]|uniref:Integral membrane protein n=1 Tax=Streptomyces racemochromogenes TaxID=67353 RepID=A0ABW7PEU3_9ACTN